MKDKFSFSEEEQEEITHLIHHYDSLLNKFTYSVYRRCSELEFKDIKQNLILRMIMAYRRLDKSMPEKEFSFYYQVLQNESNLMVRKYFSPRNQINLSLISLDEYVDEEEKTTYHTFVCDSDNEYYNPEMMFTRKLLQEKFEACYNEFSEQEKQVYHYYQSGKSIAEIAKILSKSKKTIYNTMNRIKLKIKVKIEN